VPVLESATPLDLPRILRAFESSRDETLGLAMIAALERSPARAALRADMLRPHLANYPDPVKRAGERLIASVQQDSGKQAAYLESLLGAVGSGDAARGQTVFNSTKAACLSCHTIGYIGGRIGPDLTKIGQVRGDRDLLESIVFPSASFARGYETVVVHKRGGAIVGGVLRSDAPDEVIVSDVSGNETRIARGDVADMQPAAVSLMPPGFGDLLTRQEMADLLAFLRAAK
jgi:putative heme-binding domain-containing protein